MKWDHFQKPYFIELSINHIFALLTFRSNWDLEKTRHSIWISSISVKYSNEYLFTECDFIRRSPITQSLQVELVRKTMRFWLVSKVYSIRFPGPRNLNVTWNLTQDNSLIYVSIIILMKWPHLLPNHPKKMEEIEQRKLKVNKHLKLIQK